MCLINPFLSLALQIPLPAATRPLPSSSGNRWIRSIRSWAPNAIAIATTRPDAAIIIGVLASASTRCAEHVAASTSTPARRIRTCSDSDADASDPTREWDRPYSFVAGTVSESAIARRRRQPTMPGQPARPAQLARLSSCDVASGYAAGGAEPDGAVRSSSERAVGDSSS